MKEQLLAKDKDVAKTEEARRVAERARNDLEAQLKAALAAVPDPATLVDPKVAKEDHDARLKAEEENAKLKEQLKKLKDQGPKIDDLQKQLKTSQDALDKSKKDAADLQAQVNTLTTQVTQEKQQITQLQLQVTQLQNLFNSMRGTLPVNPTPAPVAPHH